MNETERRIPDGQKVLYAYVDKKQERFLKKHAKEKDISVSKLMRNILDEYVGAPNKDQNNIEYEKRKCLICDKVYTKSWFIDLREKSFFLCECCRTDLVEALK